MQEIVSLSLLYIGEERMQNRLRLASGKGGSFYKTFCITYYTNIINEKVGVFPLGCTRKHEGRPDA
jgi:hypothetical protein